MALTAGWALTPITIYPVLALPVAASLALAAVVGPLAAGMWPGRWELASGGGALRSPTQSIPFKRLGMGMANGLPAGPMATKVGDVYMTDETAMWLSTIH